MRVAVAPGIESLVKFIRLRLARIGRSQRQAAADSGLDPGSFSNIMIGRVTKSPSIETLEALGQGLRVDPDLLIDIIRGKLGTTDEEIGQLADTGRAPLGFDLQAPDRRTRDGSRGGSRFHPPD